MQQEMPRKRLFSIFAVSLAGAALAVTPLMIQAQGRGGPKPPPPAQLHMTTTVYDRDSASGALLLFRSDDYNGADQATYDSTVDAGAGWGLNLYDQSLRWIWVTLSQPVAGSPPNPAPDAFYWQYVEVYSRCWDANNQEVKIQLIPAATSMNRCSFGFDFGSGKNKYKLVMGPSIPGLVHNTVGTGWATVSCTIASGTICTDWTIVPNMIAGNGNVPTVANLYKFANNGSTSLVGQYYNTYRIHAVTYP
jgi:hypothetical protein